MSYSSSTDGPWSEPVLVPFEGGGDTNLACIIRKNSSLVCLGRPGIGMLYADSWRDVKTYGWHKFNGSIRGEDPMVWSTAVPAHEVAHEVTHEVAHEVTHETLGAILPRTDGGSAMGSGLGSAMGSAMGSASSSTAPATVEVLHAVTHGGGWGDPYGFHYWSTDGGRTWEGTDNKVYENIIEMKDGSTHKILSRRER
jgi:hypothetical protein